MASFYVDVAIRASSGAFLEQGPASNVNGSWEYTATTALPIGQVVTIEVTAKDRAGNASDGASARLHT